VDTLQNSRSSFHIEGKKRKRLYVEIACENCGEVRRYPKHNLHPKLCRSCSYESRSLGAPAKLTCVGYQAYKARKPSFAETCPHETEKPRKTLKGYRRHTDDGEHAFVDEARGQYRCKWCAGALFLLSKREKDVRKFLKSRGESV
jgi:hypothetical protein